MTTPPMPPISTTGNDRFSKILFWVGILIIPTILIIQVLVYQPFFAHLDDASFIRRVESGNAAENLLDFGFNSGGRGLTRGSSMITSLPSYWLASSHGPIAAFLLNALLVTAICAVFVGALAKAGLFASSIVPVGLLSALLWPFTYELVFFRSLDEKGVLLTVGLVIFTLSSAKNFLNDAVFIVLLLATYFLALNSKTQVAVFGPALMTLGWALYRVGTLSRNRMYLNTSLSCVLMTVPPWLDLLPGSYGSAQRAGDPAANAQGSYAMLILGIVVAYGVYVGVRFLRGNRNYLELVPLVMMATFWASIVYFGYRNYFLSIFGVMFGSAVAIVVGNLKSVKLQQLATVGLIVVTVGWTLYRIPQVFEPLHGIGAFTQGRIAKDLADEGAVIYTSCVEGSGHFSYYTERKWGVTPEFKPLEGANPGYNFGIPDDGQYVFGDRRLCSAPGEIAEWDVIWASPGDDGFRLYKRPA